MAEQTADEAWQAVGSTLCDWDGDCQHTYDRREVDAYHAAEERAQKARQGELNAERLEVIRAIVSKERAQHEREGQAKRADIAERERDEAREQLQQVAGREAELHDILSGFEAITDPEAHPELFKRSNRVLGAESGSCGNSICAELSTLRQQLADTIGGRLV